MPRDQESESSKVIAITPVMIRAGAKIIADEYGVLGPSEAEGLARDVFVAMAAASDGIAAKL